MKLNNEIRKYLTHVKVTKRGKQYDFEFDKLHIVHLIENDGLYRGQLEDKQYKTYYELIGYYDEEEINKKLLEIRDNIKEKNKKRRPRK